MHLNKPVFEFFVDFLYNLKGEKNLTMNNNENQKERFETPANNEQFAASGALFRPNGKCGTLPFGACTNFGKAFVRMLLTCQQHTDDSRTMTT